MQPVRATFAKTHFTLAMHRHFKLIAALLLLTIGTVAPAQDKLKDGTTLAWTKDITVGQAQLKNDSVSLPALTVPVYESKAGEVWGLLKKELPGASFKKQGSLMKAAGVSLSPAQAAPADVLAQVVQDKKQGMSTLTFAFLKAGTNEPMDAAQLEPAMRELGVNLNKAVVQGQLNQWEKVLGKAGSKAEGAAKDQAKAQSRMIKAQSELEKITREKSKLQNERAVLQKEVDLYNQKWTLSQNPKDLKKLAKARDGITKNDNQMAKSMDREAKVQRDLSKSSSAVPDAQKAKDQKTAAQADVQRTVDALRNKLNSIR